MNGLRKDNKLDRFIIIIVIFSVVSLIFGIGVVIYDITDTNNNNSETMTDEIDKEKDLSTLENNSSNDEIEKKLLSENAYYRVAMESKTNGIDETYRDFDGNCYKNTSMKSITCNEVVNNADASYIYMNSDVGYYGISFDEEKNEMIGYAYKKFGGEMFESTNDNNSTESKNDFYDFLKTLNTNEEGIKEYFLYLHENKSKSLITSYNESYKKYSDTLIAQEEEEKKQEEADKQAKLQARERTFSAGKYIVGTDIDEGTYDIQAISGGGNIFISPYELNEIMGVDDPDFYLEYYSNASLTVGSEIEIKSTLTVKFIPK